MEHFDNPMLTRRGALAAGMTGLAGAFLAACGGTTGSAGPAKQVATTATVEPNLVIANWVDFQAPGNLKAFAAQEHVRITKASYGSEEELLAKLEAGGSAYDLVVPGGSGLQQLRERNLAQELNHALLPNIRNVLPQFDGEGYDPGNRFSVPKDYGITSFFWRPAAIRTAPRTLRDGFDAIRANPRVQVNLIESPNELINAALAALGHSINTTDNGQLDDAKALLLAIKPNVDSISSTYLERGQRGEIDLALGYSGDARRIEQARAAKHDDVRFLVPEGRCQYFVDLWVIPTAAKDPVAAHKFINFILDPKRAAAEQAYVQFGSTVKGTDAYVPADLAHDPIANIPAEAIRRFETAAVYTPAVTRKRNDIYTAFKAA
jgi:spermidine/putrescine-binding protein